jgi:CheY-like chemotaxis protein
VTQHVLLIVDDSDDHRFITVTELRRVKTTPPFTIEEASNANDALQIIDRLARVNSIVLILCDYRMPRMGGLDLLRVVRSRHPGKGLRFVVYSSTDQGVAEEAVAAGADEFMVKPMDLQQFRAALKRLVDEWYAAKTTSRPLRRSI